MKQSKGEALFSLQCRVHKLKPEPEFRFHPVRKWRFDFCWPDKKLAVEIEGAIWTGGRHQTGSGFTADCEKLNAAILLGYRVLRFTTDMVSSGEAIKTVMEVLKLDQVK